MKWSFYFYMSKNINFLENKFLASFASLSGCGS
jgi:hypothetical protein